MIETKFGEPVHLVGHASARTGVGLVRLQSGAVIEAHYSELRFDTVRDSKAFYGIVASRSIPDVPVCRDRDCPHCTRVVGSSRGKRKSKRMVGQ